MYHRGGKKWKNLMKELNWMNRVQTGKYFLKKSSVLVCFGFKCLHSKHPWGQNVQVKISRVPLGSVFVPLPALL